MDKFNEIAMEVVKLIKLLPGELMRVEDEVVARSIWLEFCEAARQELLDKETYPGEIAHTFISPLVEDWVEGLADDEKALEKAWLSAPAIESFFEDVDPAKLPLSAIVEDFDRVVFERVVQIAKNGRPSKPYKRVAKLDRYAFHETLAPLLTSTRPYLWGGSKGEADSYENPADACRAACRKIFGIDETPKRLVGLKKQAEPNKKGLPSVVSDAIEAAKSFEDYQKIVDFAANLKKGLDNMSDNRWKPDFGRLMCSDPAIYFDFARGHVLDEADSYAFVEHTFSDLTQLCPNRDKAIGELLLTVVRRLTGDLDALSPLLHGLPGVGKSFLVEQLCEVFNSAGIVTEYIHQPMTGGYHRESNDVSMSLQGITSKWGNARHGLIYEKSSLKRVQLVLVALDEVDKCSLEDYLVTLLDPRQALQDAYWRDFVPDIDMRSKVVFFGTANNIDVIRKGGSTPLWSRLAPINMPGYSPKEAIDLVANLVSRRPIQGVETDFDKNLAISKKVVGRYAGKTLPSVRALIDQVNRELYLRKYPVLNRVLSDQREEYVPLSKIGFMGRA